MVKRAVVSLPNQARSTTIPSMVEMEWYVIPAVVGGITLVVAMTILVVFKFILKRRMTMSDTESRLSAAYRDGFLREDSGPKWRSESLKRSSSRHSNNSNEKNGSSDIPLAEDKQQQTRRLIGQDGNGSIGFPGGIGYGGVAKESRVDALWCPQLSPRRGSSCSSRLNSPRESKIELETRGEKSYPVIGTEQDQNERIVDRPNSGQRGFIEKCYDEYKCKKDILTDDDEKDASKPNEVIETKYQNEKQNLGKLFFGIKYDHERCILSIYITKAQDLTVTDNVQGNCDPYVKLQLLPDKKLRVKTRLLRKNRNPVFDEQFDFYNMEPDQVKNVTLQFSVYSFDRFSRDYVIGEVRYPLIDAFGSGRTSDDLDQDKKEEMSEYSGERTIENADAGNKSFSLQLCEEILPQSNKVGAECIGEILLSLCFNPANCQLIVTILKTQNIPPVSDTPETIDSYVKIYLKFDGQRLAKKRTASKSAVSNPVFNESFTFQLPRTPSELATMLAWNCYSSSMSASTPINRKFILPCRFQGQTFQTLEDNGALENSNYEEKLRSSLFRRFSICSSTLLDRDNGTDNPSLSKSSMFGKSHTKRPAHILERFTLSIFLVDEEKEGSRDFVGRVEIGSDVGREFYGSSVDLINSSVASEHWKEIIANPKKQIAKWYQLTN